MFGLHDLLKEMLKRGSSDLHVTAGCPPKIRTDGHVTNLGKVSLTPQDTKRICYSVLTDAQKHQFEENNELDLSFGVKGLARFRANIYIQKGAVAGAFRKIPFEILPLDVLGLPKSVVDLTLKPRGLILVTGPTGSGKSTTLASMIDKINTDRKEHILTIEDPIEFIHNHKNCVVNQREIHSDTLSFKNALKSVLRQDPDVVLVGELRDLETIEAALTIAETGHVVFATLHTNSAAQTINRIIDVFPAHQQQQIRAQLSFVLEGVISQILVPKASGTGRVLAAEVLIPTPAVRNLIREDKVHQIYSQMQVGQAKFGMQTLNQALANYAIKRVITMNEALRRSSDPDELQKVIEDTVGKQGSNNPMSKNNGKDVLGRELKDIVNTIKKN
ncbi:type IV pilus twitching motility protein PilT [bacterium]|nr:type IV pilus twitching motility protein PilT [bacterium]